MEFVPHNAPLVVLAFLGTVFVTGVAGVAVIWSLGAGRIARAAKIAGAGALVLLVYGAAWLGRAWFSEERTLAAGESKYFCEIDCHLAYTVERVTREEALGEGDARVAAGGVFLVVTIRTWFDERTISARRSREALLFPGPRNVRVVDEHGRSWRTSLEGQKALRGSTVSLTQPLRPGESFETQLVFDVPADVRTPRLLLSDAFPLSVFLIGHENAPGAARVWFSLADTRTAGS